MARLLVLLPTLIALGAAIAACGGGDDPLESTPEFDAAYAPVNEEILGIAEQSVEAIGDPSAKLTPETAQKVSALAEQADQLAGEVAQLDPPEDLADATQTVQTDLEKTASGLEDIAAAAEQGDQQAAAAAIEQLAPVGQELNGAQDVLAEATGTATGQEQ